MFYFPRITLFLESFKLFYSKSHFEIASSTNKLSLSNFQAFFGVLISMQQS